MTLEAEQVAVELYGVSVSEQKLEAGKWHRHRHGSAYAAVILSGGYFEYGDTGRWHVESGDIVAHAAFEAHGNQIIRSGSTVLNIPIPPGLNLPAVFRIADPDLLINAVRSRERDILPLLQPTVIRSPLMTDWPDLLAADLRQRPVFIGNWAHVRGLAAATVSRGFRDAFETTAVHYRLAAQTRSALQRMSSGLDRLADVAQACGFADQAHMSRAIVAVTGVSPGVWRRGQNGSRSRHADRAGLILTTGQVDDDSNNPIVSHRDAAAGFGA